MKHYIVLWSILSSLILIPNFNSEACYLRGYFFSPLEDTQPNLLSWEVLDKENSPILPFLKQPIENAKQGNLQEWYSYFNEKIATELLHQLIYKSNAEEIDQIAKERRLPQGFENEAATAILKLKQSKAFFEYLAYAKRCEPLAEKVQWGEPDTEAKNEQRSALSQEGQNAYNKEKDDFLRLRYAYQVLRLEHYTQNYGKVIALFDELVQPLEATPSIMYYWAMEHLAGAYSGQQQLDKANFYFAKVFWHAPSRRTVSHRSINLLNEKDWNAVMRLCETDEERAALYATRAYRQGGDKLAELEAIIPLAPNGEMTKVLAVDELQEIEGSLLRSWFHTGHKMEYSNSQYVYASIQRAGRLKTVLAKLLAMEQLEDKAFWQTLHAYVLFLLGDTQNASIELAQVLNNDGLEKTIRQQVEVFAAAMEASQMPVIGEEQELRLLKLMPQLRNVENMRSREGNQHFLRAVLHSKYSRQEDKAKAYLCHFSVTQLLLHPRLDYINALLDFVNQPAELNAFEQFLLGEYGREEWKNMLYEMRGTAMLREGEFAEAAKIFQRLPKAYFNAEPFQYDPNRYQRFVAVKDEFDLLRNTSKRLRKELKMLPVYEKLRKSANKLEVAQALLELEKAYKAKNQDWRYAYLQMAAWKEMSYVGAAWRTTDYFVRLNRKSGIPSQAPPIYDAPSRLGAYALGNLDNYYEKRIIRYATEAVYKAQNPELEAALYFELNEYLNMLPAAETAKYMVRSMLSNTYKDTKYYQEVITQCGYFSAR